MEQHGGATFRVSLDRVAQHSLRAACSRGTCVVPFGIVNEGPVMVTTRRASSRPPKPLAKSPPKVGHFLTGNAISPAGVTLKIPSAPKAS